MLAENSTKSMEAISVAVVCSGPLACVCIIASARYERTVPNASVRSPIQIDTRICLQSNIMLLKVSKTRLRRGKFIKHLVPSIYWGTYDSSFRCIY